jgi:hypothetical protein
MHTMRLAGERLSYPCGSAAAVEPGRVRPSPRPVRGD